MSEQTIEGAHVKPESPARSASLLQSIVVIAAIALATIAILRYAHDRHDRQAAEKFLTTFDVGRRRPAEAATLDLTPAADLGANVVADIALSDALRPVPLGDLNSDMRDRWLHAVEHVDEELDAARAITLTAAAKRPGWAYHWSMLGKLVYAAQRRRPLTTRETDAQLWQKTFALALDSAPGDDEAATFAAGAYLETWPGVAPSARHDARALFQRALEDPVFADRAFPPLMAAVGHDDAIALLPNDPGTLRAALDSMAQTGDIDGALEIYARWQAAEWALRRHDLGEIEERARLDDVDKLRELTIDWLAHHHASDFDTMAGRQQVTRVLQLTSNDRIGSWQNDPRAEAVRFLLNHRMTPGHKITEGGLETAPGGAAIGGAVSALSGVPEPVRARARLLAGDIYGAESLFARSDTAGAFEWTPFLLDLARYRLAIGEGDAAHTAIESLAGAARSECDALLVEREIAQQTTTRAREDNPAINPLGSAANAGTWSPTGTLSLCVDPERAESEHIVATLESDKAALVSWGWNDGHRGAFVVPRGRTFFRVPVAGLAGRNTLFIRTIVGGPVKATEARIETR